MLTRPRFLHQARSLVLLSICLLILGAVPTPAAQARTFPQPVDNSLPEFTRGTFQRSSLSSIKVKLPAGDVAGAVQLLPVGNLKPWRALPYDLPRELTDLGAVAINNHIFVIGGTATVNNATAPISDVLSATIDQTTGALITDTTGLFWHSEPSLPSIQTSDRSGTLATDGRAVPAVAAVADSSNPDNGYIYVIGGNVRRTPVALDTISSYAVNIARVVNGHIDLSYAPTTNGWATGPHLPNTSALFPGIGVQSASAMSFTTGGKTYIYLFGGLMRYRQGTSTVETGSKTVFYAQVGANGQLFKPSSPSTPGWDNLTTDIPVPSGSEGLWDGTLVADHFDFGGAGGDALYLTGGQLTTTPTSYNNNVFRALINSNGTIAWQTDVPPLTLPEPRTGLGGVDFGGGLYLTGGRAIKNGSPGPPEKSVLTTYVEDDLKLAQLGVGSTFISNNPDPLPVPRVRHATVVVPAIATDTVAHGAYVYVIAGQGDTGFGSNTVILGEIGINDDTRTPSFTKAGWYYSAPHDTILQGAQVQQVLWTTVITRPTMDIQMSYRISTATNCKDPTAFNGSTWQPLDGSPGDAFFSRDGSNSMVLGAGLTAHCFQYRANLINNATSPTATPALLNVSIVVYVPGSPDLKVLSIDPQRGTGNSLTNLYATILNHNDDPATPTQPADWDGGGSFFVDLFVSAPNGSLSPPVLPLTDSNRQGSKAYVNISKSAMGKNTPPFTITQWCKPDAFPCEPLDVLSLFPSPGTYRVYVAVDSYNYVPETPVNPAEQNNIGQADIVVPTTLHTNFVPVIFRP